MVRTTIIQSDLAWEDKASNLKMFSDKLRALKGSSSIVILPEMFNTGFSMNVQALSESMDGETIAWMKEESGANKMIITGSLIINESDRFFNRMVWVQPDGKIAYYDKRHLFAYAGEDRHFSQGEKRLITSVNGIRFMLQVCYDLRFPVWSRQQGEEYDVLVYVANWPEKRSHAWKSLLAARAIENQCYVIGVNRVGTDGKGHRYSGDSSVIDPLGEILWQSANREENFTFIPDMQNLQEIRKELPFLKDADRFTLHP